MIKKIKKIFSAKAAKASPEKSTLRERKFSYMLTQNSIGKAVIVKAADETDAEKKLKMMYPDHDAQFLWEWK